MGVLAYLLATGQIQGGVVVDKLLETLQVLAQKTHELIEAATAVSASRDNLRQALDALQEAISQARAEL